MSTDVGTGTTVAFTSPTDSWTAVLTSVSIDGVSRESVETSHMGTTGGRTFIPGDLYDPGELTLETFFTSSEQSTDPLWEQAAVTMTVTFPDSGTWVSSGFCTSFTMNDPLEDAMTATITFKASGDITVT